MHPQRHLHRCWIAILASFAMLTLPAAAYAQSAALTQAALDNATYHPVNQTEYGSSLQLKDGRAMGKFFTNFLNQSNYVFGDLDGDGADDALALVDESLSGVIDGQDIVLAAYLNKSGKAAFADTFDLGHAINVDSLTISGGVVTLNGKYVGPGDAWCCASHPFSDAEARRWQVRSLTRINRLRVACRLSSRHICW
jgi:hypothetical protein